MTLSNLRIRLNKSRKLRPTLCMTRNNRQVWGMRSVTDETVNYQVTVVSSRNETQGIVHSVYTCHCQRVTGHGMVDCEGGKCATCYHALGAIRAMATKVGKKVVFCKDLEVVLLKRRILNGVLIEVRGGKTTWGVVYNG
jgi:hypothetical protein